MSSFDASTCNPKTPCHKPEKRKHCLRFPAAAQNPQTPFAKSTVSGEGLSQVLRSASTTLLQHLTLGWSHYVTLLSVTDPEARRFYEIEATDNGWSVRELKRQLNSSLYERLALSRDKHEVRRLAREGQVVEKAST